MDQLVTTARQRFWNTEAYARDQWVKGKAETLKPGSWVLDAGAGASKYRPFFTHCRYETQDFCQYEGELVRYLAPINYVCEITAIPLPDGCLDAILCTEVIEHVVNPIAVLVEFKRLLKPGGRLFITAPMLSSLHMEPYHFYGGYTHYWYRHWLPRHGLKIDEVMPVGGPGRSVVIFAQMFYNVWAEAEKKLSGLRRWASLAGRAVFKVPAHIVLPRVLPKLDPWLGSNVVCNGYMVAATRLDGQAMTPP
jgi:SAM-dependent methyltransferase